MTNRVVLNKVKFGNPDLPPPVSDNIPDEVTDTLGFLFNLAMQKLYRIFVIGHDKNDQRSKLNETNEVHPLRPVLPDTLLASIAWVVKNVLPFEFVQRLAMRIVNDSNDFWRAIGNDFEGYRVYPTGKIIVNIKGALINWWRWIVDLILPRNATHIVLEGNGYFDLNNNAEPLLTKQYPDIYNPNPGKNLKLMAGKQGGSVVLSFAEIQQGGKTYNVIHTLDAYDLPHKDVDGNWYVGENAMNPDEFPHLFSHRENRRRTKKYTWLSPPFDGMFGETSVIGCSDGGIQGGSGKERWPTITDCNAAIEHEKLIEYPELPARLMVFKRSLIYDGNLTEFSPGLEIFADAYKFYSNGTTFIHDQLTEKWFLGEYMEVTADPELREYATGFDYRCHVARIENGVVSPRPWMGPYGYRIPDPGWLRTEDGYIIV